MKNSSFLEVTSFCQAREKYKKNIKTNSIFLPILKVINFSTENANSF